MNISRILVVSVMLSMMGCDPGQPTGTTDYQASGYAAALSQSEFNRLAPETQYLVANKLLGTLFRGISAEDFFDLSNGTMELRLRSSTATFLTDLRASLKADIGLETIRSIDATIDGLDAEGNPTLVPRYVFDTSSNIRTNNRPRQLPLARIKEYPISREFFNHWMAYFLSNTIMFSPAYEMETTDMGDVQSMYRFLVTNLEDDKTVREIVRSNLPTLARWRVSRSPENHALEAYELYLGLFETEVDSYRGGIACKDYYLTPENEDYLIRQTDFPNTVPQLVLDSYYVTTCNDLYDAIAGHPLLLPRVTEVIINYLMAGRSLEDRLSMISAITASGAETFEDIFLGIIFSRQYLINTERPRSYEESLMPLLDALRWSPVSNQSPVDERIFINIASNSGSRMHLQGMGWDSMSLKIGRLPDVPLDGLSFANYHKSLREDFLMRDASYRGGVNSTDGLFYDVDSNVRDSITDLSINEFVDFLFLNVLQRKPSTDETSDLVAVYTTRGHITTSPTGDDIFRADRYDDVAEITFDYISRLPELYYFRAATQEGGV